MSKAHPSNKVNAPKEKVVLTTENAIQEIRNLRAGKLAVLNVEYIDLLLADYDARGLALNGAQAEHTDLTSKLALTLSENAAILASLERVEKADQELSALLVKLNPAEFTESSPLTSSAIRMLGIMKENDDVNAVVVRDLMTTIKRQELQLAAFGVAVNPNPDIPTFTS